MMKYFRLQHALLIVGTFVFFGLSAQSDRMAISVFEPIAKDVAEQEKKTKLISVKSPLYFNLTAARHLGKTVNFLIPDEVINLPNPEGGTHSYRIVSNRTMDQELVDRFNGIHAVDVQSITERGRWGKVSLTPKGFHAMIFEPGGSTIFIDPVFQDNPVLHVVYRKSDFETEKLMDCQVPGSDGKQSWSNDLAKSGQQYNSCAMRTYRLAVAATGEYTIFQGGTVEDAMAGIVITINRVTGIYERDFGVSFTLIGDNPDIVYTNPATDPFTNGNPGAMIQQNQANTNEVIGAANYDVGHVFGTNSGGLAGLGVTCSNNQKARGVTGSAAPIGDPFDVDYVAHEIGHQFGSNHCFNNACGGNRNNSTAAEPGSGSTIMAYAGICNPNVQNNSDDHFHGISMREIGIRITQDNCPVLTEPNNTQPQILSYSEEVFIPVSTPFVLSAVVFDAEDDQMTYNWEQMDVQIAPMPPQATSLVGPNFRSFSPIESPERFFPTVTSLALNQVGAWQRLPSVERSMSFRLSVRDNNPLVGCTQYADLNVNVVDVDGPFALTYPNGLFITWQGLSYETITWDVAGTDQAPIGSELIDLYLSTTSSPAFNILLAEGVPNTGAYTLQVPNISTNTARVMARSGDGHFYDLSRFNFAINSLDEGFAFETEALQAAACQGEELSYSLTANVVGDGLSEPIALSIANLPEGITAFLSQETLAEGEELVVTLATTAASPAGLNAITIIGEVGDFSNEITILAILTSIDLLAPELLLPENESQEVSTSVALTWEAGNGPGLIYGVEIALDPAFNEVVEVASQLSTAAYMPQNLEPESTYYWRVSSANACVESSFSAGFEFTTFSCVLGLEAGAAIAIPGTTGGTALSGVVVGATDPIVEISVSDVIGSHGNVSQLYFSLQAPDGNVIELGDVACGLELTITSAGSVEIQPPSGDAQSLAASAPGAFGPGVGAGGTTSHAVLAYEAMTSAEPTELCGAAINAAVVSGKIALVRRGNCPFTQKVLNAQNAGAVGVVVINNAATGFIDMGGNSNVINIPSVMVSLADGQIIEDALLDLPNDFNLSFSAFISSPAVACGTDAAVLSPVGSFASLQGSDPQGDWVLRAINLAGEQAGVLTSWKLDVCTTQSTVSVVDAETHSVQVYPNPSAGLLNVRWDEPGAYSDITLTDLRGRVVGRYGVGSIAQYQLNMYGMAYGVYLLTLQGEAGQHAVKVVHSR